MGSHRWPLTEGLDAGVDRRMGMARRGTLLLLECSSDSKPGRRAPAAQGRGAPGYGELTEFRLDKLDWDPK